MSDSTIDGFKNKLIKLCRLYTPRQKLDNSGPLGTGEQEWQSTGGYYSLFVILFIYGDLEIEIENIYKKTFPALNTRCN
jgi:hypothetical protein